jgi:hypothetical protein
MALFPFLYRLYGHYYGIAGLAKNFLTIIKSSSIVKLRAAHESGGFALLNSALRFLVVGRKVKT